MKKFEINGKNHKRAYRRHCAEKKLKQRARKWEGMFSWVPRKYGEPCEYYVWGEIWEKIKSGEYGCWLRTTGKPCSCEGCSPTSVREPKWKVLKEIYNTIFEENETEGLTLD